MMNNTFSRKIAVNKLHHGFTLIELLVVIAIIGILASVVFASLNIARDKGADAAIKSNLKGVANQAAIFYDDHSSDYTGICVDTTISGQIAAAITAAGVTTSLAVNFVGAEGTATCNESVNAYAVEVPLKTATTSFFCVDSAGLSQVNTTTGFSDAADYTCN